MPHADEFDPFDAEFPDAGLRAAARAYRTPPPVPADAMWEAIQARRASTTPGVPDRAQRASVRVDRPAHDPDATARRPSVRRADTRLGAWGRAARRWTPPAVAAAALLAIGVGLGRYSSSPHRVAATLAVAATHAPSGASKPAGEPSGSTRAAPVSGEGSARAVGDPRVAQQRAYATGVSDTPVGRLDTRRDVRAPALVARGGPAATASDVRDAASAPLRAAADQHLADAEVLLTAFGATNGGSGQPVGAAPDSAWARDLLTTTRLLLDSPAGRDPARRSLLEALELVLVQIARLPHADTPTERALIERAIRNGDLMARLRTAVPSGPGRGRAVQGT